MPSADQPTTPPEPHEPPSPAGDQRPPPHPAVPDPALEADAPMESRPVTEIRRPSTVGGVVYLVVLAVAVFGVVLAATGAWRGGLSWLAGALVAAAVARLALSDADAGMLRVRHRYLDAAILIALGAVILLLSWTIPDQPG